MHKLLSILVLTFVYISITFSQQAVVEIPILIEDSNGHTKTLIFGLDPTATPGIDWDLGEMEVPPYPPQGAWDARFINYPGQSQLGEGSWKDIRNAPSFPYSGTYNHRIRFQPAEPNYELQTITVSWDLPSGIVTGSIISNTAFGGDISEPFVGSGSVTILDPVDYEKMNIVVVYSDMVPVELTSFTAAVNGQDIILNWTTATELNNQGFDIERASSVSMPVQDWEKIGYVPGFGTTTEPRSYSFIDENVSTGTYTYRLKQIDFGGSYEYSPEVEVTVDFTPKEYTLYQNYPNPFNPTTTIKFALPIDSRVKIDVYNTVGQLVETLVDKEMKSGYHEVYFDASQLASGVYLYKLESQNYLSVKKMLLLK